MKLTKVDDNDASTGQVFETGLDIWDALTDLLMHERSQIRIGSRRIVVAIRKSDGYMHDIDAVLVGRDGEMEGFIALVRHYVTERDDHPDDPVIMIVRAVERALERERFSLTNYGWDEIESLFLEHFGYLE